MGQNSTDNLIVVIDGKKCEFPYVINVYGRRWTRVSSSVIEQADLNKCEYKSGEYRRLTLVYRIVDDKAKWLIYISPGLSNRHLDFQKIQTVLHETSNGNAVEIECKQGMFHGPARMFFRDGSIKFIGTINEGIKYGPAKGFHENGSICWTSVFHQNSILPASTRFFDRNGNELLGLTEAEINSRYEAWVSLESPGGELPLEEFLGEIPAKNRDE